MPACTGGLLTRTKNILWRIEDTCGTAETLAAADGISRLTVDSSAEYVAPREDRDLAQSTLSRTGTLESTKAININVTSELNTPDTMVLSGLVDEDVESILYQSGNLIKYTFAGAPTMTDVAVGQYLFVHSAADASNNGTFPIAIVGSDYVTVINRSRDDITDDVAAASTAVADICYPLEYAPAIEACSQDINIVRQITVGTVTVGTGFVRNQTITGGTSTATGRVLVDLPIGAGGQLYYQLLTGVFQTGELITGPASGSATSSSGPSTAGYSVVPKSSNQEAITARQEEDGYQWTARSAMGEMTMAFESSKKAAVSFALQGAKSSAGDQALTTVTRYTEQPPILKAANILIGSFSPVVQAMAFAQNNEISMRQNANATGDSGFESARITGRRPTLTITMEWELAANFDIITGYDAGTDYALSFNVGSAAGKKVVFYGDEAEISAPSLSDDTGRRMVDLEFLLKGTGSNVDREYEFLFI
jgi:hypothetical protein